MRLKSLLLFGLGLVVATAAGAGEKTEEPSRSLPRADDPVERWELRFESGVLWRVGGNGTPLDYVVMPQILTLQSPPVMRRSWRGGHLVLRSRYSLLLEPIVKGPETHYAGVAASGIFEWWDQRRTRALFFSSGGGFGLLDSRGYDVAGAQGQDFNLNWFVYLGARHRWRTQLTHSIGIYFQHISNRGMDAINPGLDAVGPMLSVGWNF